MAIGSSDLIPPPMINMNNGFQPVPMPMPSAPMYSPRMNPSPVQQQPVQNSNTDIGQPEMQGVNPLAVSQGGNAPAASSTLPAPQPVNVVEFDLAYNVEQVGPSGVSRAELWVTRDDGRTWTKWAEDEDRKSPFSVNVDT